MKIIRKLKDHWLKPRFNRLEFQFLAIVLMSASFVLGSYLTVTELIIPRIFAATSPWTQTDWSGGTASGTITTTVTTYESESNIDTTGGQIQIDITSGWSDSYTSWGKRQGITVTNSGSEQTDYQTKITVDYDADMQTDFDDIRFSNSAGDPLDFWIQTYTESTDAIVWVEIDTLAAAGDTTVYMYYDNAGASSGSNGDNTFLFFDDFDDGTIDAGKWNEVDQSGGNEITETGGKLVFSRTTNDTWDKSVYSIASFSRSDLSFETDYTWESNNSAYDALMMGWKDNTSGVSYTNFPYAYYNQGNSGAGTTVTQHVYEDGASRGAKSPHQWISQLDGSGGEDYYVRLRMKSGGGAYYEYSTDAGENFTTAYDSSYSTESNLRPGWAFYSGIHHFDNARVRKWLSSEPTASFGSEESLYATSATLTSNILNAEFAADWGNLTYTTSGTGTTTVKVRTDSSSDMSGATAWGSCSAISSGSDISSNSCVTDTDQYLQYQVTLQPDGANTPILEDISIAFTASDQVAPDVNATSVNITGLGNTDAWTNDEVTISWTAGEDDDAGNGLAGYCIALDEVTITGSETSNALNPTTTAGSLLNAIDDGITSSSTCGYIVNGTSIDLSSIDGLTLTTGKRYFFSINAVDLAGNVYSGASNTYQDLVDFKYDDTAPTNVSYISAPSTVFGNVADMSFSWPTSGGSAASDSNSGVIGWQYSLDSGSTWRGPDTESTLGITYIEDDSSTSSHTLTEGDDGSDISVGTNTVYLRAVDGAGNYSTSSTYRTAALNYGGAAPTFEIACDLPTGITITPSTSTSNSFALSWDAATATGDNTVESYYYMVNRTPPSTLSSLESNSTVYIANSGTSVAASTLVGSVKGSNTVYVVAVDNEDNYSQSNCLKGTYTLNSSLPDPAQNLTAADSSIKSDELWRASLTWSAPSYAGTGELTYTIQRSEDNATWSTITTTSGTAYTDTVTSSKTYYYRVGTSDTTAESIAAPTYTTSVSVLPKGTWDSAPSLSSGPTVSLITTKRATISWSTSRTADSKVQYGTSSGSYFDEEPSNSDQVTSHEIKLTNLSPGTKYYYKVKWTDEDGNTGLSDEQTFVTDPAPTITDPQAIAVGLTTATIKFTSTGASSVKIYYGVTTSFGGLAELTTATSESTYTTQLSGLEDGTKYFYKINTFDSEGDEYEGSTLTFETLPAPRISNVRIQQVKNTAQPTAYVTWSTNTDVSSIVTYHPVGNPAAARDEVNVTRVSGEHSMIIRGLSANTPYTLIVKGRDVLGNEAQSDPQTITTATDTRPPAISDLKIEGSVSSTADETATAQFTVSWTTDEPSTSQVEFGEGTGSVYTQRSQEDSNLTFNHLVVISGLTPSRAYHLRALSKDSVGNESQSVDTVAVTPKASKSALNLVINNLSQVFGFLSEIE